MLHRSLNRMCTLCGTRPRAILRASTTFRAVPKYCTWTVMLSLSDIMKRFQRLRYRHPRRRGDHQPDSRTLRSASTRPDRDARPEAADLSQHRGLRPLRSNRRKLHLGAYRSSRRPRGRRITALPMVQRLSFEFFPPNTEQGRANLHRTRARLAAHTPEFYSVTYGAGGSTRDRTFDAVAAIAADATPVAPHLSIGNDGHDTLRELLDRYQALGINRIVALRGDVPSGMGSSRNVRYAAELVELIRSHSGNAFHVEVAAYPETHPDAPSPAADLDSLHYKEFH